MIYGKSREKIEEMPRGVSKYLKTIRIINPNRSKYSSIHNSASWRNLPRGAVALAVLTQYNQGGSAHLSAHLDSPENASFWFREPCPPTQPCVPLLHPSQGNLLST